ncbi:PLD nuclease N-terminal domain-containing protein [Kribbella swartbergensis]
MVRFLPFLISLALSVYALFSCIQTPDEDVPHLPKLVWIVLIVFVPFVGPIVWLLMLRSRLGRRDRGTGPVKPAARPVAPDDDPDFLASLDRYRDPRTTVKPPEPPKDPEPESAKDDEPTKKKAEDDTTETPSEPDDGKA